MAIDSDLAYLTRAFDRLKEATILEAQTSRQRVQLEASAAGALQSGRTLMMIRSEYVRVLTEAATKMVRLAFDATESTTEAVYTLVEDSLVELRNALSENLASFLRNASWAEKLSHNLNDVFLDKSDKIIGGTIDDFRNGILEGVRLTKDPLVNVISSITNSPGAIMQAGIGNVQKVLSADGAKDLRFALDDFVKSEEVQGLTPDDKQSVIDVTDVLNDELDKSNPDASRLARWAKRLLDVAEKIGISVAAKGLSDHFFGNCG